MKKSHLSLPLALLLCCFFASVDFVAAADSSVSPNRSSGVFSVPYTQNFDNLTTPALPDGWAVYDANQDGDLFRTDHEMASTLSNIARSTPNFMCVGYSLNGKTNTKNINDWAFTPLFHLEAGTGYRVRFYSRCSSTYATYNLKVFLSDGQQISDVHETPLLTRSMLGSQNIDYSLNEVKINVQETGDYSVAIWCGTEVYAYALALDDFVMEVDFDAPKVTKAVPTNNATDVPTDTEVYALFDQPINALNLSLVTMRGATNAKATVEGNKLIIAHDPFPNGQLITVSIPPEAIEHYAGGSWSFTVVDSEVIMYEHAPTRGQKGVWPEASVSLSFNKTVEITDPSKIKITGATGVSPRIDGNMLYIDHDPFVRDLTCTVSIEKGAIKNFSGLSWEFSVVKAGDIPDETHLYGPIYPLSTLMHMSENGRYVVGRASVSGDSEKADAFLWDLLEGTDYYRLKVNGSGIGNMVSNDGFIVGRLIEGNCWFEGKYGTLASIDATTLNAITPDRKVIVGYNTIPNPANPGKNMVIPYAWRLQEDGNYLGEQWARPATTEQGVIIAVSADGQKAVGRIRLADQGTLFQAIYWTSKDNYVLTFDEINTSNYLCISANGRYAGLRIDSQAAIHDLETGKITVVPNSDAHLISAITDDGFAVGTCGDIPYTCYSYVYSDKLGFMTLDEYAKKYLNHIDEGIKNKLIEIGEGNSRIMSISSDGKNWVFQRLNSEASRQDGYVLHLQQPGGNIKPRPTEVTGSFNRQDRTVNIKWNAPVTAETVQNYLLYEDDELIATVDKATTEHTILKPKSGHTNYCVAAEYADGISPKSDPIKISVVDSYDIPFAEKFEPEALEQNFWTLGGDMRATTVYGAGVEGTYGLSCFVNANKPDGFSATLVSKPLDAGKLDKVYLSYMMLPYYYEWKTAQFTDDMFYVDVSVDGQNWVNVQSFQPQRFCEWYAEILDISEQVAGTLFNFRFRFEGVNKLQSDKTWFFDNVIIDTQAPAGTLAPAGAPLYAIDSNKEQIQLIWPDPSGLFGLTQAKTLPSSSFGNEGVPFIVANKFTKEELTPYIGLSIQSLSTVITGEASPLSVYELKTAVFINGNRVDSSPVITYLSRALNTFPLETPVTITNDIDELIIGIEVVTHGVNDQPMAADGSYRVAKGKGDIFSTDGGKNWANLSDIHLSEEYMTQRNWYVVGNLSKEPNRNDRTPFMVGYNIYCNGQKINKDMPHAPYFVTPYIEGNYTVRAFSLEEEMISAESEGVDINDSSVKGVSRDGLSAFYPNPAANIIYVPGGFNEATVSSLQGELLLHTFGNGTESLRITNLPEGVYILSIKTDNGVRTERLAVKR